MPELHPSPESGRSALGRLAGAAARRPGLALAASILAAALLAVPASRLHISADIVSMLPDGRPAFDDYRAFLHTFGGAETIFVGIEAAAGHEATADQLGEAARRMAESLRRSPAVARARAGTDPEDEAFFLEHVIPYSALFLDLDREAIGETVRRRLDPEAVQGRVRLLRERLLGPAGGTLAPLAARDPLGIAEEVLRLHPPETGGTSPDPVTGALLSPDGRMALVVVAPARAELDPEAGREMIRLLEASFAEAAAEAGTPLQYVAVGGPLYAAYDEATLRADLVRTVVSSGLLVAAVLVLAFGGIGVPLAALAAVALGLVATAGVLGIFHDDITAVGIGFAAILVGLGVDYVVHAGGAMRPGRDPAAVVAAAFGATGAGILASALTTCAGFLCLSLAHFRPLREMGLTVAAGILAIAAATAVAAAAVLRWTLGRSLAGPAGRRAAFGRMLAAAVESTAARAAGRPVLVLVAMGLLTAAAIAGLARLSLDADPGRLRPAGHPALAGEQRLASAFSLAFQTITVVVRGRDLPEALDRADAAGSILRDAAGDGGGIWSPADWLVGGGRLQRRLARLRSLPLAQTADRLERELDAAGFRPEAFAPALEALRRLADGGAPPMPDSLPDWLAESIREVPGGVAVAVRVRTPEELPEGVVDAIARVAPGASVASVRRVGTALEAVALADLKGLGGIAFAVVLGVILVSFRGRLAPTGLALLPVVAGSAWTLGLWGALGLSLDLFCLAVLPVMIGIGVDDGLHVLHRRTAGAGSVRAAVGAAAEGMVVTSLTTAAGFASLAWSHVPALRNGGLLIATGVLACLVATAVLLPAVEALGRRGRRG